MAAGRSGYPVAPGGHRGIGPWRANAGNWRPMTPPSGREWRQEVSVSRGLDPALAEQVADQLMAHDAIGAHARDELGISATRERVRSRLRLPQPAVSPLAPPCPSRSRRLTPEASLIAVVSGTSCCPRAPGRAGGARRRRRHCGRRGARHVLGCACDGVDVRGRHPITHSVEIGRSYGESGRETPARSPPPANCSGVPFGSCIISERGKERDSAARGTHGEGR